MKIDDLNPVEKQQAILGWLSEDKLFDLYYDHCGPASLYYVGEYAWERINPYDRYKIASKLAETTLDLYKLCGDEYRESNEDYLETKI